MRYNQLGNTGLFVSEICLGTMTFGPNTVGGRYSDIAGMDQQTANQLLVRAIESGVNFIDTADVYSFGGSERMLGQAIKDIGVPRKDLVIATKFHGTVGEKPNDKGASRGHIMDSIELSLERLQTDHIDLYQIHATDPVTPIEETLRALDDLVSRGLVRYIGVSNWQAWRITKALGISERRGFARFETIQAYYSLASRDLEREIVPMMTEEKMGLMVWSPLAGGLLSGKFGPGASENVDGRRATFDFPPVDKDRAWVCIAAMREIAKKHDTGVAAVALAYILAKPFVTSVIIGARRVAQLEENLAATDLRLDTDDLQKLEEVSRLNPEYPAWMLARQAADRRPKDFVVKA